MSNSKAKYYGYIEFLKDRKNSSVNVYDNPVNDSKFYRYNMTLKDYNPEIYEFRVDIQYTYVIPSTILSRSNPLYKQQDVALNIQIFAQNKETKQDIGYLEANKMYYNIQNDVLSNPAFAFTVFDADYTILVNKKGLFENINNLETKIPSGVYPPVYWELFFYEKEIPLENPPFIAGKWKVVEYRVIDGVNTIENPLKNEYVTNFRQNGRFVDSLSDFGRFYGVWEYLNNNIWSLTIITTIADNNVFKFTPIEYKCNVTKMDYINYEAGTIPILPLQTAKVGYGTWTKIE